MDNLYFDSRNTVLPIKQDSNRLGEARKANLSRDEILQISFKESFSPDSSDIPKPFQSAENKSDKMFLLKRKRKIDLSFYVKDKLNLTCLIK